MPAGHTALCYNKCVTGDAVSQGSDEPRVAALRRVRCPAVR